MSQDIPIITSVISRKLLNPGSEKETFHVELSLMNSLVSYQPGDALAIWPQYPEDLLKKFFQITSFSPEEIVVYKEQELPLKEILKEKVDLRKITKKFVTTLLEHLKDPHKTSLKTIIDNPQEKPWEELTSLHDITDVLTKFPKATWNATTFCSSLQPLLPRYYSISSSQNFVGNQIDLTIGCVEYKGSLSVQKGVCSNFLCKEIPLNSRVIKGFLHPNSNFRLPEDSNTPIIMIGPGTGIAPFRGFIQERFHSQAKGKNLLFFGERHQQRDFYYHDFWESMTKQGYLEIVTAFSRDQKEKIYVQDRLLENKVSVWNLLKNGAFIYVCGDASKMAKDVEQTLLLILEENLGSREEAKSFLTDLRKKKRYQRDVY